MESTYPYGYEPLTTANSIRIVILLPGTGHDQLKCTLSEVAIDESPNYEALSYVWGDEAIPAFVICDDLGRRLPITQNLAAALFRFRLPDKPRVLWADAICINQENVAERGHQVRLMGRIYRGAFCVLIWLGEAEHEHLELVSACFRSSFIELTDEQTLALKLFFRRQWFHRAWTFQESILAKHAQVHCGSYQFSKQTIYDSIQGLRWATDSGILEPEFEHDLRVSSTMTRSEDSHPDDFSFPNLLLSRRGSQCKDPRDLIYSLLGVASDTAGIEPNYTKSIQEVFTSMAWHIITSTQDLSILGEINTRDFNSLLPSWVPDWREIKAETIFSQRREDWAGSVDAGVAKMDPFPPGATKIDAYYLTVQGVRVDEIEAQVEDEDLEAFFNLFRGQVDYPYPEFDRDPMELAFLRTMALDYWYQPEVHGSRKPKARWRYNFKVEDFYDTDFRSTHADLFRKTAKGQNLFRSKDNFMGLGPRRSQRGDLICVICGVECPVLLRPTGNKYLFVGLCYVYGLMDGGGLKQARTHVRERTGQPMVEWGTGMSWLWKEPVLSEMQEFILK